MMFKGFTLDKFQEEAIEGVHRNNSVLVSAPTGSGKTLIADYIIDKDIQQGKRVIYTAPIKALSNQKYKDFCNQYGEEKIGLITGDLVLNSGAEVLIMTTEVYRNMAIIKDPILDNVSYCIMDEIHFISDEERGYIWEESIIFSPSHIRFLFLSATIPNAEEFAAWVASIKFHKVDVIKHAVRPVPLERKFYDSELGLTTIEEIIHHKRLGDYPDHRHAQRGRHVVKKLPPPEYFDLINELRQGGKLPCIYFVFSRAKTQEYALKLAQRGSYLSPDEQRQASEIISHEYRKLSAEAIVLRSAKELRQCLNRGVAFHNAGILPDLKHIVEKLFGAGLVKVLFATETFAVGINMPAKTVCFDSMRKFTGTGFRLLNSKEYFQISGRAGRRGIDKTGLSVALIFRNSAELDKIAEITKEDRLPLRSQFRLTYNTVLNMIHRHSRDEVQKLLQMNFFTFQQLKGRTNVNYVIGSIKARFTKILKTLQKLGYVTEQDELTEIGIFTSKIFSEEMEISQIFKGDLKLELDELTILLLLGALTYEGRRGNKFYTVFSPKVVSRIVHAVRSHPVLKNGNWVENVEKMTAIIQPCVDQKSFSEILKNTNLLEGDLIRILLRIMDKLEQIDKALETSDPAVQKIRNCKQMIRNSLEGIHVF